MSNVALVMQTDTKWARQGTSFITQGMKTWKLAKTSRHKKDKNNTKRKLEKVFQKMQTFSSSF